MLRKDIKDYWKENGFVATLDFIKSLEEPKKSKISFTLSQDNVKEKFLFGINN